MRGAARGLWFSYEAIIWVAPKPERGDGHASNSRARRTILTPGDENPCVILMLRMPLASKHYKIQWFERSDEARWRLRRNICEENVRSCFTRASTFNEKPYAFLRFLVPLADTPMQKYYPVVALSGGVKMGSCKETKCFFHEIPQRIAKRRFP